MDKSDKIFYSYALMRRGYAALKFCIIRQQDVSNSGTLLADD
jgi:hypothetical protein